MITIAELGSSVAREQAAATPALPPAARRPRQPGPCRRLRKLRQLMA
jgi:hypothetical protein